jgi:hypothetical protein
VRHSARKLAGVDEFRWKVFVAADEPPEIRRQRLLEHLKIRAEKRSKLIAVSTDGVMFIDVIATFCLRRGFINRSVDLGKRIKTLLMLTMASHNNTSNETDYLQNTLIIVMDLFVSIMEYLKSLLMLRDIMFVKEHWFS